MTNITFLAANRPRLLKQALDSIGDLSCATVTIRDANMNADVFETCNEWAVSKDVKDIHYGMANGPLGTGPARNEVIGWSRKVFGRGDYLYLSDDDVRFTRLDWLSILINAYEAAWTAGFRVIGGYNHPFNRPIDGEPGVEYQHYTVYPVYALASQSMLMRWSVWDQFGPFCDTPAGKVCQSEDVAFSNRIREAGYKVGVISPALLVNAGITNSFGEHIPGWELVKSQCPEGIICE